MTRQTAVHLVSTLSGTALLATGLLLSRHAPPHVDALGWLALGLTVVVTAALAGGHLAGRLGQAAVLGELDRGHVPRRHR